MSARPTPPEDFDENPPLDADFFGARPAAPGEAARLRPSLERIVKAHEQGRPLDEAIAKGAKTCAVGGV